jgi:nitroreductase
MAILKEIRDRKSVLFFSEKKVSEKIVGDLIEAARWAPSGFNNQPWRYIFVDTAAESRKALEGSLMPGNGWAKTAPYLIVVAASEKDQAGANGVPYHVFDSALSVMNLVLEAEHHGLRTHQMGGFFGKKVAKAVGLPAGYQPLVVIALGYEGTPSSVKAKVSNALYEKLRQKIARPRTRKSPEENFFFGKWGG